MNITIKLVYYIIYNKWLQEEIRIKKHSLFNSQVKPVYIGNMRFKATFLSKGFGTNLTNELWCYSAFIAGMSN